MKWHRLTSHGITRHDKWVCVIRSKDGVVVQVDGPWRGDLVGKTLQYVEQMAQERGFELKEEVEA